MNIKTAGNYRFFASSDDGSKVFVDGALVVNNDGLHGLRRKEGTRRLASGPRRLIVAMFERGGAFSKGLCNARGSSFILSMPAFLIILQRVPSRPLCILYFVSFSVSVSVSVHLFGL